MDHQGHGLALDHVIYKRPFKAQFESVEVDCPKRHEGMTSVLYPNGVGEKLRLVNFEKDKPSGWNPTLVAHEGFFTDVPGFENLAEGSSSKVLGSLALARQGKYFYWGYSVSPERMTEGAKATLCNALHYMAEHRGALTTLFVCKTRKSLRIFQTLGREKGYQRGVEEHFPGSLTDEARPTYTPTWEGVDEWLPKYLPYVYSGKAPRHEGKKYKTRFDVDADAMALGTPNHLRASLERWIKLSETKGEDAERAQRCLRRYVDPKIAPKEATWASWYAKMKARIVFVESTGFWWQENPVILECERRSR